MDGDGTSGGTSSDGGSSTQGGLSDDDRDGIFGWFARLGDSLDTALDEISALPSLIGDKFADVGNFLLDGISNALTSLLDGVLEGIRSIFIPDANEIKTKFNSFVNELGNKFGFNTSFFESLFTGEGQPVTDVEKDYNIPGVGNMKLKFFDAKYLVDGVTFFRPFIRGFIVLLMCMYNINMLLSFIGQHSGINPESGERYSTHAKRKGG